MASSYRKHITETFIQALDMMNYVHSKQTLHMEAAMKVLQIKIMSI